VRHSDPSESLMCRSIFKRKRSFDYSTKKVKTRPQIKADTSVNSCEDLSNLLCSLRFWEIKSHIPEVTEFCLERKNWQKAKPVLEHHEEYFTYLRFFTVHHMHPEKSIMYPAAALGELELLKYLYQTRGRYEDFKNEGDAAAEHSHLDCLKYLVQKGYHCDRATLIVAAYGGNLECFQYVYEHMHFIQKEEKIRWRTCVNDDNIEIFVHAYTHCQERIRFEDEWYATAVLYNGVQSLQYAVDHGLPLKACLFHFITRNRTKTDAFVHLCTLGCPWPEGYCKWLVEHKGGGMLPFLKLAHELGCPYDAREVIETAAAHGEVDCMAYLHKQGCLWDERVTAAAARASSLHCLRYAHTHGCPWDETACTAAVRHVTNLMYLHKHGCPWDVRAMYRSGTYVSDACEKYLNQQGCLSRWSFMRS